MKIGEKLKISQEFKNKVVQAANLASRHRKLTEWLRDYLEKKEVWVDEQLPLELRKEGFEDLWVDSVNMGICSPEVVIRLLEDLEG